MQTFLLSSKFENVSKMKLDVNLRIETMNRNQRFLVETKNTFPLILSY